MSVRNNEERLGAAQMHADGPINPNANQDPLNFIVPTMFVDLPSRGLFYPPGHVLHKQESIEIRFMTAKDEDILTSPSLIKKGVVLDRLLKNLILDSSIRLDDLLLGDKNAILIEARISGYGPHYAANITCPNCEQEHEEEFDLDECKQVHNGFEEGQEGPKLLDSGNFLVTLPQTGVECEFRLLCGRDEKVLVKSVMQKQNKKTVQKEQNTLSQQLKLMIVSLNGRQEQEMISYFAEKMPIQDARALRKYYEEVNPAMNLVASYECEECEHEEDVEVPLSVGFFWPKQ
jgi:hypothetical protein